jgi:F0F1-type ATP synthase assembly protein I
VKFNPVKILVPTKALQSADQARTAATTGRNDSLGQGMDLALTVLLFLLIGFGLDSWLDTKPMFTIALVLLAAIGSGIAMYYRYAAAMKAHEAERAANRAGTGAAAMSLRATEAVEVGS